MQLTDDEMRMMARVTQDTVFMQWLEERDKANLLALAAQREPNELLRHSGRYNGVHELLDTLRDGASAFKAASYPNRV